MLGLGNAALGSTPYGLGTPATADAPPKAVPIGSRFLNPRTRDWQLDSVTGQYAQHDALSARVLRRLLTSRGTSSAIPTLGIRMPAKIDGAFTRRVQDAVRLALHWEIDVEKVLRLDSVAVEVADSPTGRVRVTVSFTDLETLTPSRIVI